MSRTDELFETAFRAMQASSEELGITGVAMAAFLEDTASMDWKLAMRVMGKIEVPHSDEPGWNIIAFAGSKIGETMLTHAPSGHCPRSGGLYHGEAGFAGAEDPLNGEGAEFVDLGDAHCVCAFSGGTYQEDYIVGCAGADAMKKAY